MHHNTRQHHRISGRLLQVTVDPAATIPLVVASAYASLMTTKIQLPRRAADISGRVGGARLPGWAILSAVTRPISRSWRFVAGLRQWRHMSCCAYRNSARAHAVLPGRHQASAMTRAWHDNRSVTPVPAADGSWWRSWWLAAARSYPAGAGADGSF